MVNYDKSEFKVSKDIFVFTIYAIFSFCVALYYCLDTSYIVPNVDQTIYFFCVVGTIQFVVTLRSIAKMQGEWFSPYFLFFCFLFIFSYGQFFMWTFGIHYQNELTVSRHVRFISQNTVVQIQAISLHLLAMFHLGALFATRNYDRNIKRYTYNKSFIELLRLMAIPMLIISMAINMYFSITGFRQAAIYGYAALFEISLPPILKYLSYMFIPSLFLNLVLNKFSKKSFYILSVIFLIYAFPLVITGDRGSWIYFLGPWIWCYIKFVNSAKGRSKSETRKIILVAILLVVLFFVSSVFVSIRSEGYRALSSEAITLKDLYTPFVKPFFEMGQSARILGIIIDDNLYKIYPYGNTYIADILGMVWPTMKVLFGFPDLYVENWMSSEYLNMVNYGVGFSTFAEAYLNGGLWFAGVYVGLFGMFIGKLATVKKEDVLNHPIKTYLALSTVAILGPSVRATLDLWLRQFFWGVLMVLIVGKILSEIRIRKKS